MNKLIKTIGSPYVLLLFFILSSCKKQEQQRISIDKEQFHIQHIENELKMFSIALNNTLNNVNNLNTLKKAIYSKKKDENITLKDLNSYFNSISTKNNRNESFEQQLYYQFSKYSNLTFDEFKMFIDKYDLTIYWTYIELWDGVKKPVFGYPINEEEDVNSDFSLLSYKIFTSHIDTIGSIIQRTYLKENPVILICPNEDYENGSPVYYSNETYIWLSDSIQNKRYKDVNKERLVQDIPSRLRVYKINTNGHDFDGNGGPEFRFFRNGFFEYQTGNYGFYKIVYLNLTASAAATKNWIGLTDIDNILDSDWTFIDYQQMIGVYEQDGGVMFNKTVSGVALQGELNLLGIPIVKGSLGLQSKITRKDDLYFKTEMTFNEFVHHVQNKNNWGWGFYTENGVNYPIRATADPDLKIVFKNY
ncbi:MAG: hypothetical protein U0T31_06820 [Chitinophagales bacterium]